MLLTSECSGLNTKNDVPKIVSGRVVKTSILLSVSSTLKDTFAPSERPIQLRCISLIDSGQSKSSKSSNKRSAYSVILVPIVSLVYDKLRPPRSETPSTTSSFDKTVPKAGHQFTATSSTYAKPLL